jgi:agmatine/peptidylarginine deiminase
MSKLKAQWKKQDSVLVTFPYIYSDWYEEVEEVEDFYVELIDVLSRYQTCIVLCNDIKRAKNKIIMNKNIQLVSLPTNDTWIRDYGPIGSYSFGFNGWGLKFSSDLDNGVAKRLFPYLKEKNMILEGGSIDYNGSGVLLTTAKCLLQSNRNPAWSKKKIEKKLRKYFDLKKIIWIENGYLAGDDTDSHIDTLARFVDKDSIVYMKCYDQSDEHYEELSAMEDELKKTKYNLIALPLPSAKYYKGERLPATYCNFVIINGAVVVPSYGDPNDNIVIDMFKELFPKRDIVSIDATVLIHQHGSIHCATCNIFS